MPTPIAATAVAWARRRLAARARDVRLAHRLVAPSESLRRRLESRIGPLPMTVIPNIVDPGRATRLADAGDPERGGALPERYLLAAGKLNEGKGFDLLVDWLGRCDQRLPLVLAGAGRLGESLRVRAEALGVELRAMGWIDAPELLRLMRMAIAVVLPSRVQEALARTLLEALAMGTPVISWPVESSREVIDEGRDGWVVASSAELDAALSVLAQPGARERMAAAALAKVNERYAPAVVYPRIAELYDAALADARGSGGPA